MVRTMLNLSSKVRQELSRALSGSHYERNDAGIFFPRAKLQFGGVFGASVDNGPMQYTHNSYANEGLNAMLNAFLTGGAQPTGLYLAPFTNNVAPTAALTAATFAATQGEYIGYTQAVRQTWTPNGASTAQLVSNSNAPATFTVGTTAATVYGAGLLTVSTMSATTGTLVAAGLFGVANTLNPGSTLTVQYGLTATAT